MLVDQLRRLGIDTREQVVVVRFIMALALTDEQKREFIQEYITETGTALTPEALRAAGAILEG